MWSNRSSRHPSPQPPRALTHHHHHPTLTVPHRGRHPTLIIMSHTPDLKYHHRTPPTLIIMSFMKSYSKRLSCSCSTGGKPSNSTPLRAS